MLAELLTVSAGDVRLCVPELLRQMRKELLDRENLYNENALDIDQLVESTLRPRRLLESLWPPCHTIALPNDDAVSSGAGLRPSVSCSDVAIQDRITMPRTLRTLLQDVDIIHTWLGFSIVIFFVFL